MQKRTAAKFLDVRLIQAQMGRSAKCLKIHKIIVEKLCFKKTLNYCVYFSLLLDLFISFFLYRTADSLSITGHSSITKDCLTAKHITMPSVGHCVLDVPSLLPGDVSRPCSRSSIQSTLCAHSAWNSWWKERSRSRMTSHIAMFALINYLVEKLQVEYWYLLHILYRFYKFLSHWSLHDGRGWDYFISIS